jgi:hypothetical protein
VIARGRRHGSIPGSSPGTYVTKIESAALTCQAKVSFARRSECFAYEVENFACETFSFRMSSAKPLKTFWFSRPRNFRYRGFQCYQSLAGRFCFALFLGHVFRSGRRSVTEFSLPNNTHYHGFSFLENKIPIRRSRNVIQIDLTPLQSGACSSSTPMAQANPSDSVAVFAP